MNGPETGESDDDDESEQDYKFGDTSGSRLMDRQVDVCPDNSVSFSPSYPHGNIIHVHLS